MINNVGYVTQIENDIRRILKTLLSKNVEIEIDQDNDSTVIIARSGNYRNAYIFKNKNSSTYQIDLYGVMGDDEITLFFSSQSSVINFLNNNFFG